MYTYITHSLRILSTPFLTNIRARAYTKTLELFEIKRGTQIAMDSKLCNRVRRSLQGHDQQHEHLCLCVHARSVPFIVCLLLKDHGCPQNRSTLWRVGHRVMQRLSPDRAQDPPLRALFPNKALSLPPSPCLRVSLSLSLSCWTYHELVEKTRSAYDHIILKAESLRQVETVQAVFADELGTNYSLKPCRCLSSMMHRGAYQSLALAV